jgi:hypothetical protein
MRWRNAKGPRSSTNPTTTATTSRRWPQRPGLAASRAPPRRSGRPLRPGVPRCVRTGRGHGVRESDAGPRLDSCSPPVDVAEIDRVMGDGAPRSWPWRLAVARWLAAVPEVHPHTAGPRLVKTVHGSMALRWLRREVEPDATLVIVRHPANVIGSWRDLGWGLQRFGWRRPGHVGRARPRARRIRDPMSRPRSSSGVPGSSVCSRTLCFELRRNPAWR